MVKLTLSNDVKLRENLVSAEDTPPITVIFVNFNTNVLHTLKKECNIV
jgi:hypothetical protein